MSIRKEQLAENVTLYCGDCREVMAEIGNVDICITDPPYGVREDEWDDMSEREFARFSMSWLSDVAAIAPELIAFGYLDNALHKLCEMVFPRVRPMVWAKPPGSQLTGAHERGRWFAFEAIFHCYAPDDSGGEVARLITVARKAAGLTRSGVDVLVRGKKTGLCYRWEESACLPTEDQVAALRLHLELGADFDAALAREYALRAVPAERFDVLSHRTVTAGRHPCEKPLALMGDLVEASTAPGAVVLDPFLGSGSTGVASVRVGRGFIGIERDPHYFDIACKRIADEYSRPRLFAEPIAKPLQEVMFG